MCICDLDYLGTNPKKQIPPNLPLFTDLLMFCMPLTQRRKQCDLKKKNKTNNKPQTKLLLNGIYCQKIPKTVPFGKLSPERLFTVNLISPLLQSKGALQ